MNKPTHEEINERAHQLSQNSGRADCDATQNWLDAERELTSSASHAATGAPVADHSHSFTLSEGHSSKAVEERAAMQRKAAQQPQVATHTGPKTHAPQSGKPLWNQPHSS